MTESENLTKLEEQAISWAREKKFMVGSRIFGEVQLKAMSRPGFFKEIMMLSPKDPEERLLYQEGVNFATLDNISTYFRDIIFPNGLLTYLFGHIVYNIQDEESLAKHLASGKPWKHTFRFHIGPKLKGYDQGTVNRGDCFANTHISGRLSWDSDLDCPSQVFVYKRKDSSYAPKIIQALSPLLVNYTPGISRESFLIKSSGSQTEDLKRLLDAFDSLGSLNK